MCGGSDDHPYVGDTQVCNAYESAGILWMHAFGVVSGELLPAHLMMRLGPNSPEVRRPLAQKPLLWL